MQRPWLSGSWGREASLGGEMNIGSLLANPASNQGGETAVFHGTRPIWTYREIARRASTLAHGLQHRLGIRRGDRILPWSSNSPGYLQAMFATSVSSTRLLPLHAPLHPPYAASIAGYSA